MEEINEKESENNHLRRQITTLRQKISGLEGEVRQASSAKENIDLFVTKGMDTLRAGHKEFETAIEEVDTEKMIIESKYKQLGEKLAFLSDTVLEMKAQLTMAEKSTQKLKGQLRDSRDDCMALRFQMESLKQQASQGRIDQIAPSQSNDCELIVAQELQKIREISDTIRDQEYLMKLLANHRTQNEELSEENKALKVREVELLAEIDDYKNKLNPDHEDEQLRGREPSLYEYLLEKKRELQSFEEKIDRVESYINEKDTQIGQVITTMMEKETGCSCGKQKELDSLQEDLAAYVKKHEHLQESHRRLKTEQAELEKSVELYKDEVKDLLEANKKGGKRKSAGKRRCPSCFLGFEKGDSGQGCSDCKRVYHKQCILRHKCDLFRLEEGMSFISELV